MRLANVYFLYALFSLTIIPSAWAMEAHKQSEETKSLIAELNALHSSITHPKLWNHDANKKLLEFNNKYKGPRLLEKEDACDHPVIIRILHLLNYIATTTQPVVIDIMMQEGLQRKVAQSIMEEFIKRSSFTLALLGRNEKARKSMVKFRGVPIFMTLINSHTWPTQPNDRLESMFVNCCFALGQILTSFTDKEDALKKRVIEIDFCKNLQAALNLYPNDADMAQYLYFMLGNMFYVIDTKDYIWPEELIVTAFSCLKKHKANINVVLDIVFFLKNVAFNEDGREKIFTGDILGHIEKRLRAFRNYPGFVDYSMNFFYDMTFYNHWWTRFSDPELHSFIFSLMKQHRNNPDVLIQCLKVLSRIYVKSDQKMQGDLIKEGLISSLIYGHHNFHQNKEHKAVFEGIFRIICNVPMPEEFTLKLSKRNCDLCKESFTENGHDKIYPAMFTPIQALVPLFWNLCSRECARKLESSAPTVSEARIE